MSTEYLCIFLILIFQQLFSFLHAYLIIVWLALLLSIFSFGDDIDGIVFNFLKNIIYFWLC